MIDGKRNHYGDGHSNKYLIVKTIFDPIEIKNNGINIRLITIDLFKKYIEYQ